MTRLPNQIINYIKKHWHWLTVILLLLIAILSLYPAHELPKVAGSDKTHHFIAYAALVFPVALAKPKHWYWLVLLFIGLSGGIELVQPYVNRHGEWLDMAANVGGTLVGVLLATFINKFFHKKNWA